MNLISRATRHQVTFLLIAALTVTAKPVQPQEAAAKQNDIYEIYSVVLPNAKVLSQSVFLITEKTQDAGRGPNCTPPLPDYSSKWNELLAEIQKAQAPTKLEPRFTLTKPYTILTADEEKEFRDSRRIMPPLPPVTNPKFQGAVDLFTLGNVYFDRDRTIAAVTLTTFAGPLAGGATWQLLEKGSDGRWRLAPPWQKGPLAPPCPPLSVA